MTSSKRMKFKERFASLIKVLLHIKEHVIERIGDFFAWWASIVYDFPYRCIIGTFVLVLVLCAGFIPGIPVWIDGADPLYSLPYSIARSQGAVHRVLFNETATRPSFVLITSENPGQNIFTWEHLEAVRQLDRLIRGQIVDPKFGRRVGIARKPEYGITDETRKKPEKKRTTALNLGSNVTVDDLNLSTNPNRSSRDDRGDAGLDILTFQDICARNPFGDCTVTGVLEMGVFDFKMNPNDPPMLYLFDGLAFNTQKKAFPPHFVLAKANEQPCSPDLPKAMLSLFYEEDQLMPGSTDGMARANMTCITRCEGFQLIYEITDREEYLKRNEDWEKVFVDVIKDNMDFGPLRLTMNAFRSRDDALRSSTSESSDILFVALTFGLLLAYSTSLNFSCDLYRSKSYPAVAGVVAAILGLIAGMGSMSLCGVAFVPTALVCPFLVVGVGVDDMFVIINGYSLAYMVDSARDRCILALKDTGLAITITTTTSLVSFAIGLNTGYLSIKNFCYFCGAGMFFGYIFVFTFFFAIHCLDAKREEENMACLFCVPTNERREARREELRSDGVEFGKEADITTFTLGALMVRKAEQNALRRHALRLRREQIKAAASTVDAEQGGPTTWSESQETRGSRTPELEIVRPKGKLEDIDEVEATPKPLSRWKKSFVYRSIRFLMDEAKLVSDELLTRVALEAHYVGKERGLDPDPSHGVLEFADDPEFPTTGDPLVDIVNHPEIPLYYRSLLTHEKKLFIDEPKGSVGLKWRKFLIGYYGPVLVHPVVKVCVFIAFGTFLGVGMYGCINLESGLDLKDLAPIGSYLNQFDNTQEKFFSEYDFPVDVFFPETMDWWRPEVQQSMRDLQAIMEVSGSGKLVTNPFIKMLEDPELEPLLQSGNQELFETTLYDALSLEGGKYKQFEQNFVWEGTHMRAWKMQILPGSMKTSVERAAWMTQIRDDCDQQLNNPTPMAVMAWNYMMTFYESDLQINSSVTSNMIVAAITMLIVAMVGIPQLLAGLIVCLIMGMIDVGIIGFMYFWGVKLNMVSMICLLISVGFSVDFTAHVCHTFMDAEGQTLNQRAIEALVLMGNPVFHGAASSILGVMMLGFSSSYIFQVFFKMMTMVTVFALMHSVIFLPVLLSIIGSKRPHQDQKSEHQANALKAAKSGAVSLQSIQLSQEGSAKRNDSRMGSQTTDQSFDYESALSNKSKKVRGSPTGIELPRRHHFVVPHPTSASPASSSGRPVRYSHRHPSDHQKSRRPRSAAVHSTSPSDGDSLSSRQYPNTQEPHDKHRILSINENKPTSHEGFGEFRVSPTAASSPNDAERHPPSARTQSGQASRHEIRSSRQRRQRPRITSVRNPRSPDHEDSEWLDEDCRIPMADAQPAFTQSQNHLSTPPSTGRATRSQHAFAGETVTELVSPVRRWKSPAVQRKRVQDDESSPPSMSRNTDARAIATGVYDSQTDPNSGRN